MSSGNYYQMLLRETFVWINFAICSWQFWSVTPGLVECVFYFFKFELCLYDGNSYACKCDWTSAVELELINTPKNFYSFLISIIFAFIWSSQILLLGIFDSIRLDFPDFIHTSNGLSGHHGLFIYSLSFVLLFNNGMFLVNFCKAFWVAFWVVLLHQ